PGTTWDRIGNNMPKEVGDIGFPVQVHPRNADVAWVFPMNGTEVWPRTSPDGKPALYMTRDGGKSWKRQDKGLPKANAHLTVYRQALCGDCHDPAGLYFGTSSGEVWASTDEGKSWSLIAQHLPRILAVEAA
ncbi:MAG TPA: glycosyl hydrolase, partial [bacterium]|nr:glycosyl hydrolase [bacterium]